MPSKIANFFNMLKGFFRAILIKIKDLIFNSVTFVTSWWRAIVFIFLLITFLYYPIGAFLVNDIDTNTDYSFPPTQNRLQSRSVEMMAHIIDREVNQKTWTPNLPFFFPSTILDNMPNFQLGMFDAMSNFSYAFRNAFDPDSAMKEVSENLSYSGTIWMFSPENKIEPVSSANKMYRDARKKLKEFNKSFADKNQTFIRRPADLAFILKKSSQNISKSITQIEKHIMEENHSWIDTKSDDVFFYNQGKIYAYYLLLSAAGQDYKDVIVSNNLYNRWVIMLKALEQASKIDPLYIRNGEINSLSAPNHLNYLAFYGLKADSNMQKIMKSLEKIQ